jgi:RHS repeat-associated protein
MDRGGQTFYYHQNTLWSSYALSNSAGVGVEGYSYDAYGYQTVVLPGPDGKLDFDSDDVYLPGAKSSYGNPFLYTGQRHDPESGFDYYKNRYNSTFFGLFMSRDPLDYAGGDMNLYAYVGDNPTNLTDPTGNAAVDYFLKINGIQEESEDDKHKNEILDSWSFGTSQSGGRSAEAAKFTGKLMDAATPKLFLELAPVPAPRLESTGAGGIRLDGGMNACQSGPSSLSLGLPGPTNWPTEPLGEAAGGTCSCNFGCGGTEICLFCWRSKNGCRCSCLPGWLAGGGIYKWGGPLK